MSRRVASHNAKSSLIAEWNSRLAAEGLPAEPEPIRRRRIRDSESRFEQDTDFHLLESPPEQPRHKRSGRPLDYDVASAKESAQDLLLNGNLSGQELEAWIGYCAGLSERVIAKRMAITHSWLRLAFLNPLKVRAGIPVDRHWIGPPRRKSKKRPKGLRYRKIKTT